MRNRNGVGFPTPPYLTSPNRRHKSKEGVSTHLKLVQIGAVKHFTANGRAVYTGQTIHCRLFPGCVTGPRSQYAGGWRKRNVSGNAMPYIYAKPKLDAIGAEIGSDLHDVENSDAAFDSTAGISEALLLSDFKDRSGIFRCQDKNELTRFLITDLQWFKAALENELAGAAAVQAKLPREGRKGNEWSIHLAPRHAISHVIRSQRGTSAASSGATLDYERDYSVLQRENQEKEQQWLYEE